MGKYDFELELVYQNSLLIILEQIAPHSIILEFGPANGRLTRYLKEQMSCQVYLVELDGETGREALKYGQDLVVGDIEQYEWLEKYRGIQFDYLIFADVLEHLRFPQLVLTKAKLLLKENGSVLLSVPNLAHNAVIINLLNNDFQYNPVGLLDDTHIHMFTKNSLEQMLEQSGLFPIKRMATYMDTERTEIPATLTDIPEIEEDYWKNRPYGEVYQYVYEAKKDPAFCDEVENYLVKVKSGSSLQVFWAPDSDFYEDYSQKVRIKRPYGLQEFNLNCPDNCKEVRIDPMEYSGLVKLVGCTAQVEVADISLLPKSHNAKLSCGQLYLFENSDPQWTFSLPESTKKIKIIIQYVCLGHFDLLNRLFAEIFQVNIPQNGPDDSGQDNRKIQEENTMLKEQNQNLLIQNQELDDENHKIKEQNTCLAEERDQKDEENHTIKAQNESLLKQNQILDRENHNIKLQNENLLREKESTDQTSYIVKTQNEELAKERDTIASQKELIEKQLAACTGEKERLIQEQEDLNAAIAGLNAAIADSEERLRTIETSRIYQFMKKIGGC